MHHHEQRHDDARDHPAEEERADRDVRHHAVDDEGQRRRDDRPERRRGGGDADRELGRVAVVLHGLDLDRAEAGGVGDRRAGHAREDHRADDVHLREPALHPADERDREAIDAAGDAGDVHEIAGEDEERHGEKREALDAGDHALGHDDVRARCRSPGCRAATRPPSTSATGRPSIIRTRKEPSRISIERDRPVFGSGVAIRSERRRTPRAAPAPNSRAASSRSTPGRSARTSARSRRRRSRRSGSSASVIVVIVSSSMMRHEAPDEVRRVGEEGGADEVDRRSRARAPTPCGR